MSAFSTQFSVPSSPAHAIQGIVDVRAWWTGQITGSARAVGDEFTYAFGDLHQSVQRVAEINDASVVWEVLSGGPTFTDTPNEWAGTTVRFAVAPNPEGARITLTHEGLVPALACFDACSGGWSHYAGSLRAFLTTGVGEPGKEPS